MSETFGSGEYTYRAVEGWAKWPEDWNLHDVAAVGIDKKDNVYAFHRGDHPMVVFDRDGNVLRTWGEGVFKHAHGVHMGPDEAIYLTDDYDHTVRKCTLDGKVLLTIGIPGEAKPFMSGEPFRKCTHTALSPSGDIYVSDGYGNARVHKYSPSGKLLFSWGQPGAGPGEFNLPHSVWVHTDSTVWVCDRENDRIQIFSPTGEHLRTWTNVRRPGDLFIQPDNSVVVGEMSWEKGQTSLAGNIWPDDYDAEVSIRDIDGNVLAKWGEKDPCGPGGFSSPHGLWVDSKGSIYVAEVTHTALSRYNRWHEGCHSIVKYARI